MKELAQLLNGTQQAGVLRMLERQAHWQKSRPASTWPEKIRQAERFRKSVERLRAHPRPVTPEPKE